MTGFIERLFSEGLRRFKATAEKEALLALYVRFLKYRIATRAEEAAVRRLFEVGVAARTHAGSLRGGAGAERARFPPLPLLLLREGRRVATGGGGVVGFRGEVDGSAMHNEVLIPLTEEVLNECIDYESRWLASLENDAEEEKRTVAQIEKLFDALCSRYSQDTSEWWTVG